MGVLSDLYSECHYAVVFKTDIARLVTYFKFVSTDIDSSLNILPSSSPWQPSNSNILSSQNFITILFQTLILQLKVLAGLIMDKR